MVRGLFVLANAALCAAQSSNSAALPTDIKTCLGATQVVMGLGPCGDTGTTTSACGGEDCSRVLKLLIENSTNSAVVEGLEQCKSGGNAGAKDMVVQMEKTGSLSSVISMEPARIVRRCGFDIEVPTPDFTTCVGVTGVMRNLGTSCPGGMEHEGATPLKECQTEACKASIMEFTDEKMVDLDKGMQDCGRRGDAAYGNLPDGYIRMMVEKAAESCGYSEQLKLSPVPLPDVKTCQGAMTATMGLSACSDDGTTPRACGGEDCSRVLKLLIENSAVVEGLEQCKTGGDEHFKRIVADMEKTGSLSSVISMRPAVVVGRCGFDIDVPAPDFTTCVGVTGMMMEVEAFCPKKEASQTEACGGGGVTKNPHEMKGLCKDGETTLWDTGSCKSSKCEKALMKFTTASVKTMYEKGMQTKECASMHGGFKSLVELTDYIKVVASQCGVRSGFVANPPGRITNETREEEPARITNETREEEPASWAPSRSLSAAVSLFVTLVCTSA